MPARSLRCSSRSTSAPRIQRKSAGAITGELFKRLGEIQEALILVIAPPPVQGIGNAGGVRMMVEDRAGRGP